MRNFVSLKEIAVGVSFSRSFFSVKFTVELQLFFVVLKLLVSFYILTKEP